MLCIFSPFGYHILWASRFNGRLSFPKDKLKRLWKDDTNQPVLRVLNDFWSEIDRFSAYDADNSNDLFGFDVLIGDGFIIVSLCF